MAFSLNRVQLVGRLGQDAETKFTPSGVAVSNLSIATERSWKDQQSGEWKKETEWHRVTVWRKEKLAEYLKKGTLVYVEARLQTRRYEKDGETRYATDIVADDIGLLGGGKGGDGDGGDGMVSRPRSAGGGRSTGGGYGPSPSGRSVSPLDQELTDDDVPF